MRRFVLQGAWVPHFSLSDEVESDMAEGYEVTGSADCAALWNVWNATAIEQLHQAFHGFGGDPAVALGETVDSQGVNSARGL